MNCDAARRKLFDIAFGEEDAGATPLTDAERGQVLDHVTGCPDCAADAAAIRLWRERADAWVDAPTPSWPRPALERPAFWWDWRQWFPVAASAAALAFAAAALFNPTAATAPPPLPGDAVAAGANPAVHAELASWREEFARRSAGERRRLIEALTAANQAQREQELATLAAMLKREMDRRAFETEDSLRYIVSHQMRGERRLNDLLQRVGGLDQPPEGHP